MATVAQSHMIAAPHYFFGRGLTTTAGCVSLSCVEKKWI